MTKAVQQALETWNYSRFRTESVESNSTNQFCLSSGISFKGHNLVAVSKRAEWRWPAEDPTTAYCWSESQIPIAR